MEMRWVTQKCFFWRGHCCELMRSSNFAAPARWSCFPKIRWRMVWIVAAWLAGSSCKPFGRNGCHVFTSWMVKWELRKCFPCILNRKWMWHYGFPNLCDTRKISGCVWVFFSLLLSLFYHSQCDCMCFLAHQSEAHICIKQLHISDLDSGNMYKYVTTNLSHTKYNPDRNRNPTCKRYTVARIWLNVIVCIQKRSHEAVLLCLFCTFCCHCSVPCETHCLMCIDGYSYSHLVNFNKCASIKCCVLMC